VSAERILVDTSVWVEYFRGGDPSLSARLDDLMKTRRICIPMVVLAEMIQGARSATEIKTIEDLQDAFTVIDQKADTWIEAGKLSFGLRKKGQSIHSSPATLISATSVKFSMWSWCRFFRHRLRSSSPRS
jgi:tRNA(fMet)-specific endonuclease VapC